LKKYENGVGGTASKARGTWEKEESQSKQDKDSESLREGKGQGGARSSKSGANWGRSTFARKRTGEWLGFQ